MTPPHPDRVRRSYSLVGRFCRTHTDEIEGCSGKGRPSCDATECLYGAEPCPNGNHFKPEGAACNFCPRAMAETTIHGGEQ